MPNERRRERWHGERGQSTALIVSLLFVFVLFTGMVANVGQAVNRRIALQIVADSGAWTGATVMATGMNHLAYWNRQIQRTWANLQWASLNFFLGDCYSNWSLVGMYYGAQGSYAAAYANFAFDVANWPRRVSDFNARELFPGETLDYAEWDFDLDALILPGKLPGAWIVTVPVDDGAEVYTGAHPWAIESPWDLLPPLPEWTDFSSGTKTWTCICGLTCVSTVTFYPVPWWKLQQLGRPYYFAWRVRAPRTRALVFDSFFGPNAIPAMKAAAVAKPVGGNIERGESKYRAKMLPVSKAMLLPYIRDTQYSQFGGFRRVVH